jgi:hypothetical protein
MGIFDGVRIPPTGCCCYFWGWLFGFPKTKLALWSELGDHPAEEYSQNDDSKNDQ